MAVKEEKPRRSGASGEAYLANVPMLPRREVLRKGLFWEPRRNAGPIAESATVVDAALTRAKTKTKLTGLVCSTEYAS